MVWHPNNRKLEKRAMELAFDVRRYQHSGREKLVPAERLEENMMMATHVDSIVKACDMQDFSEFVQTLLSALSFQDRDTYNHLVRRFGPMENACRLSDPTLSVYNVIFMFSGLNAKAIDISEALYIAHLVVTMKDYARAYVILCKYGLEAGKVAFAEAVQSAQSINGVIINDNEKLMKYALRATWLLKLVAVTSVDPDLCVSGLSNIEDEQQQKQELADIIETLYLRRLDSFFFERLCDAIMIHDGMLLQYLICAANGLQWRADGYAKSLLDSMKNAWNNIDTATSVEMVSIPDIRRNAWTEVDPPPNSAIKFIDERGPEATPTGPLTPNYDLAKINDLYVERTLIPPSSTADVQSQLQEIDKILVGIIPQSS
ncbi:hypothetical protein AX15_003005 [Amanita polypyramis BW_CC]|nr:hypothetical protein AX15_003005 [Amanita polypyramis BW_CC]